MQIERMLINLTASDLTRSQAFYETLFDLQVAFESDWFVLLSAENSALEIGLIQANHELIPESYRGKPAGSYLTVVVDDVDTVYAKAIELSMNIVEPPTMTFYGQRRMLLKDPGGILVDVSSVAGPAPT